MTRRSTAAVLAALVSGMLAGPVLATQAVAAPAGCTGFGAAATGDVMTLRLLDLRPLGLSLPPVTDLTLGSTKAGFSASAGQSAAAAQYIDGTVDGLSPSHGPLDASAHRLAPPASEPLTVNPGRLELGPLRAGTGDLTAQAAYADPSRCDQRAGVETSASAALADAAVAPGRRALVGLADDASAQAGTSLTRLRGGTAAEATGTAGLTRLAILDALRVRVLNPVELRVIAGGTVESSRVDYRAPVIAIDLPDGRTTQLDQAGRSFDLAVPAPGTESSTSMPMLPPDALTGLLSSLPGGEMLLDGLPDLPGAGGGDRESAGSSPAPPVPGLPALTGAPAVGELRGGTGKLAATADRSSLVLRLTGGEMTKEIAATGVHAKAISLRIKLLLVGPEGTSTLMDLCLGTLETAATAPAGATPAAPAGGGAATGAGARQRGHDGYGGEGPAFPPASPSVSPSPTGGVAGGPGPTGGGPLPLTGMGLTGVLGSAVVLLLAGRLLMVMARRRAA